MVEPTEPSRSPNRPPGGYLPRIAKFEAPEPEAPPKKKAKGKANKKEAPEGPEAIPAFETAEGRRRARMLVGGAIIGGVLLIGGVIYLVTRGGGQTESAEGPETITEGPPVAPPNEDSARDLYRRAEEAAGRGQPAQAIAFLEDLIGHDFLRAKAAEMK